ncbi:MAG: hypothetical protein U0W24_24160 [Bacteroidales bacterium]
MRTLKFFITLFFLNFLTFTLAQKTEDLSKYRFLSSQVQYTKDDSKVTGLLLFLTYKDNVSGVINFSDVYLLGKNNENYKLTCDSTSFSGVYNIEVSKDSKYLAIYKVGEGHPWIEIYDLQKLIDQQMQVLLFDINPYPGNIELLGWEGDKLLVRSDIDLLLKNENKDLINAETSKKWKKYSFKMTDGKFTEIK